MRPREGQAQHCARRGIDAVKTSALINRMATPDQIYTVLRKIRIHIKLSCFPRSPARPPACLPPRVNLLGLGEYMWNEPYASDSDMPSTAFFHEHRDLGGAQAEAVAAMFDELVQTGFVETKIKGGCRVRYVSFLRVIIIFRRSRRFQDECLGSDKARQRAHKLPIGTPPPSPPNTHTHI
jgi:hypothetical protein